MAKYFACQRCEGDDLALDTVELIGGFKVRLCVPCHNDWHLATRESTALVTLNAVEAKIAILIARTTADGKDRLKELLDLAADERAIRRELFALAEQWVSEGIKQEGRSEAYRQHDPVPGAH